MVCCKIQYEFSNYFKFFVDFVSDYTLVTHISSGIRQKSKPQNDFYKKTKYANFKLKSLAP